MYDRDNKIHHYIILYRNYLDDVLKNRNISGPYQRCVPFSLPIIQNISIDYFTLEYNGQKFREIRISHFIMRNIISRNIQCEFRKKEKKLFLWVFPIFFNFLGIFKKKLNLFLIISSIMIYFHKYHIYKSCNISKIRCRSKERPSKGGFSLVMDRV